MSSTATISDSLINPSSSSNSILSFGNTSANASTSTSTSTSANGFFSGLQNISIFTWILIVFLLAFFGFNIFVYLAKGTQEITGIFKPLIEGVLALTAHISSIFVGVTAAGTKTIVSGTANVLDTGLSKIESGAEKIQEKTTPSSLKSQPVNQPNDTSMDNNTLNKTLNNAKASQAQNGDYEADNSGSSIQAGGSGKSGWCFIGEDRGFRSCMEIGANDQCMSGDIFPSKDICVNPSLRN